MMTLISYNFNFDILTIVLVIAMLICPIVSFILWYMYRADLSKDNIEDADSIDYRLVNFESEQ